MGDVVKLRSMHRPIVLVVDDALSIREVMCRMLKRVGCEPYTAACAETAIQEIRTKRPHLILLDVVLPRVGGVDFCRALKASPETKDIPVTLMTDKIPGDVTTAVAERLGVPVMPKLNLVNDLSAVFRLMSSVMPTEVRRIHVDREKERVEIDGQAVEGLPHQCFRLLYILSEAAAPMERADILERLRPGGENLTLVDVTVHRLRKYLARFPRIKIEATGRGYLLSAR